MENEDKDTYAPIHNLQHCLRMQRLRRMGVQREGAGEGGGGGGGCGDLS